MKPTPHINEQYGPRSPPIQLATCVRPPETNVACGEDSHVFTILGSGCRVLGVGFVIQSYYFETMLDNM